MEKKKLTTASGRPYTEFDNSMSVGNRGPILLQDYFLHEDMAHFNRERIPERPGQFRPFPGADNESENS